MAKFIKTEGKFRIYELDRNECKAYGREYPTVVCWYEDDVDIIGNVNLSENETESIEEMTEWCKDYSY